MITTSVHFEYRGGYGGVKRGRGYFYLHPVPLSVVFLFDRIFFAKKATRRGGELAGYTRRSRTLHPATAERSSSIWAFPWSMVGATLAPRHEVDKPGHPGGNVLVQPVGTLIRPEPA